MIYSRTGPKSGLNLQHEDLTASQRAYFKKVEAKLLKTAANSVATADDLSQAQTDSTSQAEQYSPKQLATEISIFKNKDKLEALTSFAFKNFKNFLAPTRRGGLLLVHKNSEVYQSRANNHYCHQAVLANNQYYLYTTCEVPADEDDTEYEFYVEGTIWKKGQNSQDPQIFLKIDLNHQIEERSMDVGFHGKALVVNENCDQLVVIELLGKDGAKGNEYLLPNEKNERILNHRVFGRDKDQIFAMTASGKGLLYKFDLERGELIYFEEYDFSKYENSKIVICPKNKFLILMCKGKSRAMNYNGGDDFFSVFAIRGCRLVFKGTCQLNAPKKKLTKKQLIEIERLEEEMRKEKSRFGGKRKGTKNPKTKKNAKNGQSAESENLTAEEIVRGRLPNDRFYVNSVQIFGYFGRTMVISVVLSQGRKNHSDLMTICYDSQRDLITEHGDLRRKLSRLRNLNDFVRYGDYLYATVDDVIMRLAYKDVEDEQEDESEESSSKK